MPTLRSLLKKLESPKERILRLSEEGKRDKVQVMLETDKTLANVRDSKGRTPVHFAAMNGDLKLFTLLLDNGAEVEKKTWDALVELPQHTSGQWEVIGILQRELNITEVDPNKIKDIELLNWFRYQADLPPLPFKPKDTTGISEWKGGARKTRRRRTRHRK